MTPEGTYLPVAERPICRHRETAILGAGFAGLAAGWTLARAGASVAVIEKDAAVGGLARTIERNGFRFDLGGHRFHTESRKVEMLFRDALSNNVLEVARSSKILMDGRYFDYPWRPIDAISGFGVRRSAKIIADYAIEQARQGIRRPDARSFEDVIVGRFGRTMFNIFVKEYSEKVWGIDCGRIAPELADWRIPNLSVGTAVRDALFPRGRGMVRSLIRKFLYPPLGIGEAAEGMRREIAENNLVRTGAMVTAIHHSGQRVMGITVREGGRTRRMRADNILSSIPIGRLVHLLDPVAPAEILSAAKCLRFRDLIVVAIMIDRERVTDQSWIYLPERKIPFGRIHEPTNWSSRMAPPGKTLLVTEHFCFRGGEIWNTADETLVATTVGNLENLGLIDRNEVIDSLVVRVPNAYPIFEIGYGAERRKICEYLESFGNLRVIGRGGTFQYFNMDHAMESGIAAAEEVLATNSEPTSARRAEEMLAGAQP